MAALGLRILILAFPCFSAWAGKRARVRPAASGRPSHPVFERAHEWARAKSESFATRGLTTNCADESSDHAVYRNLFREIFEHLPCIPRCLVLVELFAGAAGTTLALNDMGHRAYAMDRKFGDPLQDACTIGGVAFAFYLVASVVTSGMLFCSPQCSTWVMVSMGSMGRKKHDSDGDLSRTDVREANWIAFLL